MLAPNNLIPIIMNYQYIEQLLDRYFDCQTTLQEEQILRAFFAQEDVPEHLAQYVALFQYEHEAAQQTLGADFDARILDIIAEREQPVAKADADAQSLAGAAKAATVIQMPRRHVLTPFLRAAAIVAGVLTIGGATEHALRFEEAEDLNPSATAIDPYIRKADIPTVLPVREDSRAELNHQIDSLLIIKGHKD